MESNNSATLDEMYAQLSTNLQQMNDEQPAPSEPAPSELTPAPPASEPTPEPAAPVEETPPSEFDVDAYLNRYIPNPDDFQGMLSDNQNQAFKTMRETVAKMTKDQRDYEMELASLRKNSGKPSVDENNIRKQLEEEYDRKYADYDNLKSLQSLFDNSEFVSEFDNKINGTLEEMKGILNEIGADPSILEEVKTLDSPYKAAKFFRNKLDDDIAADILSKKAVELSDSIKQFKSTAKDPTTALKEYKDRLLEKQGTEQKEKMTHDVARSLATFDNLVPELEQNLFFSTKEGRELLTEMRVKVAENSVRPDSDEVIRSLVESKSVPALLSYIGRLESKVQELNTDRKTDESISPSSLMNNSVSEPSSPAKSSNKLIQEYYDQKRRGTFD